MSPVVNRCGARALLNRSFLVIALALAGCTGAPVFDQIGLGEAKPEAQFVRGNLSNIWAEPPGSLVMLQRKGDGDYEQLVGLENRTTLSGDNFLWLNANNGSFGLREEILFLNKEGEMEPFEKS